MNLILLYRLLLASGFMLWILSLIGENNGLLPQSTIGIGISLILTGLGVYYWLESYKAKRGHYPKFWKIYKALHKSMRKNIFNGFVFMIRHLIKFYTCIFLFSIFIVFIGFLTVGQSKPVKTVQNYCENHSEMEEVTGRIKYYGILRNVSSQWNAETGHSELSLTFLAEKGVFNVKSELEKINGKWKIKKLELNNKNTGANTVYN